MNCSSVGKWLVPHQDAVQDFTKSFVPAAMSRQTKIRLSFFSVFYERPWFGRFCTDPCNLQSGSKRWSQSVL